MHVKIYILYKAGCHIAYKNAKTNALRMFVRGTPPLQNGKKDVDLYIWMKITVICYRTKTLIKHNVF